MAPWPPRLHAYGMNNWDVRAARDYVGFILIVYHHISRYITDCKLRNDLTVGFFDP